MKNLFKIELRRAFVNRYFFISVLIGLIIVVMQTIECAVPYIGMEPVNGLYPQSVFNTYIGFSATNVWSRTYYMVFPLLAALPYSSSFLSDQKTGFSKIIYTKCKSAHYLVAKFAAVFLSGGFSVLIPLLINLWLTALCVPSVIPDSSTGFFPVFSEDFAASLYYLQPYIYILFYNVLLFVVSGIFACSALAFSYLFNYGAVVLVSPFLTYISISFISSTFPPVSLMNISEWIYPVQMSNALNFPAVIFEMAVFLLIICSIYFYRGIKDDSF